MNVPEKHRAVAHAWVDGAQVEVNLDGEWCLIISSSPAWFESLDYRIKPKSKVKKWRWAWGSNEVSSAHYTDEGAVAQFGANCVKLPWTEIEVDD